MNKFNLFSGLAILAWFIALLYVTTIYAKSEEQIVEKEIEIPTFEELSLAAALSAADVNKPAEEPVRYETWFRNNATKIEDCTITHYCSEKRNHICGTGDGVTASGVPVTPYWTCAVDPSVIPYGAEVMVDYGDRFEFYQAQDCGAVIGENHIDLAVETHEEAIEKGVLTATVYFLEVEYEFG